MAWRSHEIAKQGKGAVVKNRLGPEELLVPFTVSTLVEVDLDARIYGTDVDDTPWAEGDERKEVLVGTEVELLTDTDTFLPMRPRCSAPISVSPSTSSREGSAARSGKGRSWSSTRLPAGDPERRLRQRLRGGGRRLCSEQALQAGLRDQGRYQLRPVGSGSRQGCRGERRTVLHRYDPHRHPRHGWPTLAGQPHGDSTADVMARRVQGKQFVEPQAFGATLRTVRQGTGHRPLRVRLAGDEDGEAAALELRIAANARAVRRHGVSQCQQRGSFHGDLQQGDGGLPDRQDRGTGWKPGTGIRYLRPRPALSLPIAQDPAPDAPPRPWPFPLGRALRSGVRTGADLLFLRVVSPDASRQHGG